MSNTAYLAYFGYGFTLNEIDFSHCSTEAQTLIQRITQQPQLLTDAFDYLDLDNPVDINPTNFNRPFVAFINIPAISQIRQSQVPIATITSEQANNYLLQTIEAIFGELSHHQSVTDELTNAVRQQMQPTNQTIFD